MAGSCWPYDVALDMVKPRVGAELTVGALDREELRRALSAHARHVASNLRARDGAIYLRTPTLTLVLWFTAGCLAEQTWLPTEEFDLMLDGVDVGPARPVH